MNSMCENTTTEDIFGDIRRSNLSISRNLTKVHAARERQLNELKWFDYRFMRPLEATEHFVAAYRTIYKNKWANNFDTEEAERKSGIRSHVWNSDAREFTSFWAARQMVDETGIPYEFYLSYGIEALLRIGWKRIPRPNQLYSDGVREIMQPAATEKWLEWRQTAKFTFSPLPQYRIEAFRGLPAQIAHQAWIVDQIKLRSNSGSALRHSCFIDRVLSIDGAINEFGVEAVERARLDAAGQPEVELVALDSHQLLPSCYGVLHAFDLHEKSCAGCAEQVACGAMATSIETKLVKATGSADPTSARRREQQRERTRKCRANAATRKASLSRSISTSYETCALM